MTSSERSLLVWVLLGGTALAVGSYWLQGVLQGGAVPSAAVASTPLPAAPTSAEPSDPAEVPAVDRAAPATHAVAAAPSAPTSAAPECRDAADCIGPRHADCIQAACRAGHCEYDRSACECTTSEDCDDGDPCTRDHCFARTQECIFIPQDC